MRTRHVLPWCIFAGMLAVSGRASGDDAMTDTARELFMKGAKAAEQQKWDQCRAALLAALAIKQHPQVAGNLAGCELKLKRYRDAAEHLAYFLREMKPDAPAEKRANAEAALREAQGKVETIRLSVNLAGADVRVDGRAVGRAPLADPIFVEPGPHVIEAQQEGFPTAREAVEAKAGGVRDLALELKKDEPPPPPPLLPPPRRSLVPGIAMGGAAVAGLAAGVGLMVVSAGKRSAADDVAKGIVSARHSCVTGARNLDPQCPDVKSATMTSDTLHNAGVGVLIGAGALAAAAGVYFVWPAPQVTIVPTAGTSGAGLFVNGSF